MIWLQSVANSQYIYPSSLIMTFVFFTKLFTLGLGSKSKGSLGISIFPVLQSTSTHVFIILGIYIGDPDISAILSISFIRMLLSCKPSLICIIIPYHQINLEIIQQPCLTPNKNTVCQVLCSLCFLKRELLVIIIDVTDRSMHGEADIKWVMQKAIALSNKKIGKHNTCIML